MFCQMLNMDLFEEHFKTKAQGPPADISKLKVKVAEKAPAKVSLLEANKAKNLAITLRKGGMTPDAICTAIERYLSPTLSLLSKKLFQKGFLTQWFFEEQIGNHSWLFDRMVHVSSHFFFQI